MTRAAVGPVERRRRALLLRNTTGSRKSTVYALSYDRRIHESFRDTMSSNVGLTTPRGSGTSGYVQRNLSLLKPRDQAAPYTKDYDQIKQYRHRQPDKEILEHDRKREIEVKVFELRDRLEDEGVDEDDIDDQCDALRKKLQKEADSSNERLDKSKARHLKQHQVHELAAAKIEESEKLRRALGISEDYQEGSHWKRQEERLREAMRKDADEEVERVKEEDRRRLD
ncbi:mRNA splicing factor Cwf21 [Neofusicoccum parvum]|uniref:mRNA splicing factor Cwf21 n=1 Tax=Neofusicoccum parvum TaxID=310453 RepID=A0ACB5SH55_9PEZI|nr:mRNA splicing factor Cwf21 [Neofusicoccum parvum]